MSTVDAISNHDVIYKLDGVVKSVSAKSLIKVDADVADELAAIGAISIIKRSDSAVAAESSVKKSR
jgi:hypothetical protein